MQPYLIIMEVSDIFTYYGGPIVVTSTISVFIVKLLLKREENKWNREQEKILERQRAEINREHSIFTATLNSYSASHQFSQSDRIDAVKVLWDNILKLRDLIGFPGVFFDSLLENEYNQIYDNKTIMSGLNSLPSNILTDRKIWGNVEKYRPFLGEQLWNLFHIYYIFVYRVVYKLIEGRDKKNIVSWNKDEYLRLILEKAFTDEEKKWIFSPPKNMNPLRPTIDLMEQKILFEMLKIISGELAAESDLSNARKLQEITKQEWKYSKEMTK